MQPFAASSPGHSADLLHHIRRDASIPMTLRNHEIDHERMLASVPDHIDEADELSSVASADPSKTMTAELRLPVTVLWQVIKTFGVEVVDLGVLEWTTPVI